MTASARKPVSKTTRRTILNRMLRVAAKDGRTDMATGCTPIGDMSLFTNSYSVYILNDDFGFPSMQNPVSDGFLACCDDSRQRATAHTIPVDRDTLRAAVKKQAAIPAKNKTEKRKAGEVTLKDGDFGITFNARYLLDIVDMLGADTIQCAASPFRPALVLGGEGEWGVVCPIRLAD